MKSKVFFPLSLFTFSLFLLFGLFQSCTKTPAEADIISQDVVLIKNGIVEVNSVDELQSKSMDFKKEDWEKLEKQYANAGFVSLHQAVKNSGYTFSGENEIIANYPKFTFQHYAPFLTEDGVISIGGVLVRFLPGRVVSCKNHDLDYLMSIDTKTSNLGVDADYLVCPVTDGSEEMAADRGGPYDITLLLGECEKTNFDLPPYYPEGTLKKHTEVIKHLWAFISYEFGTEWHYELIGRVSGYRYNYLTFQYVPFPYPTNPDMGDVFGIDGTFNRVSLIMGNASGIFDKYVFSPQSYTYSWILDHASGIIKGNKVPSVQVTGTAHGSWGITPYPNPGVTFYMHCTFNY